MSPALASTCEQGCLFPIAFWTPSRSDRTSQTLSTWIPSTTQPSRHTQNGDTHCSPLSTTRPLTLSRITLARAVRLSKPMSLHHYILEFYPGGACLWRGLVIDDCSHSRAMEISVTALTPSALCHPLLLSACLWLSLLLLTLPFLGGGGRTTAVSACLVHKSTHPLKDAWIVFKLPQ